MMGLLPHLGKVYRLGGLPDTGYYEDKRKIYS